MGVEQVVGRWSLVVGRYCVVVFFWLFDNLDRKLFRFLPTTNEQRRTTSDGSERAGLVYDKRD
jgi:hypothetical protein